MGLLNFILALAFFSKDRYEEDKDESAENEYTEDFIYHHIETDDYEVHHGDDGDAEYMKSIAFTLIS